MNMYNGIPISELRLIVHSVVFTIFFLVLVVALGFWLYTLLTMKNPKEKARFRKLKEKAQHDELAKKQLEKIEQKNKHSRKREKGNIITNINLWGTSVCLAIVILALAVIPGWTDYIKKDYVVYTGDITVCSQLKQWRITLADGTTVWGRGDFDEGDKYGTVIYSKRTKQFLGGNH